VKKSTILATLTVFSVALVATSAFARPPSGDGHRGKRGDRGPKIDRLVQDLQLTAEQEQQARALQADKKASVKPLRAEMRQARQDMRALWEAEQLDRAAILAAHDKMGALKQQMHRARIEFRIGLHQLLTPEQRAQMKANRGQRGERFRQGRRGKRGKFQGRRGNRGENMDGDFDPEGEEPLDI